MMPRESEARDATMDQLEAKYTLRLALAEAHRRLEAADHASHMAMQAIAAAVITGTDAGPQFERGQKEALQAVTEAAISWSAAYAKLRRAERRVIRIEAAT